MTLRKPKSEGASQKPCHLVFTTEAGRVLVNASLYAGLKPREVGLPFNASRCTWYHTSSGTGRDTWRMLIVSAVAVAQGACDAQLATSRGAGWRGEDRAADHYVEVE